MNTAMVSLLALVAALSLVAASPTMGTTPARGARNGVRAAVPVSPLGPLSMAMVMKADAAGTGCSWSLAKDRRMRFAASEDRAVVHLASGMMQLQPAAGAGDLFPFTHDRWAGDGVAVTLLPVSPSMWKGTEVNEGAADIEVHISGARWIARGCLTCGS